MFKKIFAIFLLCFLSFSTSVFALPEPTGFVNDLEGIVENRDELEEKISNFEEQTSIEIVVLTTPDFDGTYIEDYALRVFEKWGIGKEEKDNGVLIIVSQEQRESRIEVGYGLEGTLTDGVTGRIQDNAMIPEFREDNYSEGINSGVSMIMEILGGEDVDGITTNVQEEEEVEPFGCLAMMFLGFLLLVPNPFIAAAVGGVLGFLLGTGFLGITGGITFGIIGAVAGFLLGLIARLIPAPVRHGIAYSLMSSAGRRGGGGGGSSFGGFGGGSSGGGGSSRSW